MNKKLLSMSLTLTLILVCLCVPARTVQAIVSGDYEYEVLADGTAEITKYNGNDVDVTIPSTLDGITVTKIGCDTIGSGAFQYNTSLEEITMPDTIKEILPWSFGRCTNLKRVTFSSGLEKIGSEAFAYCKNIKEYIIPEGVTMIEMMAFEGVDECGESHSKLESVVLPNTLRKIEEYAFYNNEYLREITIPASVIDIGRFAFGYYQIGYEGSLSEVEGFTIYGKSGSAAETYAVENKFRFIDMDTGEVLHECDSSDAKSNNVNTNPTINNTDNATNSETNDSIAIQDSNSDSDSAGSTSNRSSSNSSSTHYHYYDDGDEDEEEEMDVPTTHFTRIKHYKYGCSMDIKWKKVSRINGYNFQYSTDKKFKTVEKKWIKDKSKSKITLSDLTKNKRYYIRIRTYKVENGKKHFSDWVGYSTKS